MSPHASPIRRLIVAGALLAAGVAIAAPHQGDPFQLRQPDGELVDVLVWGDEYYQHIESPEGHTLVRDPRTDEICYARLDDRGSALVSTGVRVGTPPAGLALHVRVTGDARRAAALAARSLLEVELPAAGKDGRDPQPSSLGEVQGITLLVDFSDEPATIPAANFEPYLNQVGYTGYGNNGSIRDYFDDVSDGALTYTNFVPTAYFRAAHPKTYYEDPNIPYGQRGRELVREALVHLDADGFDFSDYDANRDGFVDALNVFYAGSPTGGWSVGLWPHSGGLSYFADGVSTYRYQITNIGNSLALSTFVHENGHMICFWPDLYDYGGDSSGVGTFCVMCNSGPGGNPIQPCAPLKDLAGWSTSLTVLEGYMPDLTVDAGFNQFYKVPHPSLAHEYYMLENRRRLGRDTVLPDEGLAIWHVDLTGSNNDQQQLPNLHYFCTLVQADGDWDLEHGSNYGDADDLWSLPSHTTFTPETDPAATWWSGEDAALYVDDVGAMGAVITFDFRESLGTIAVLISVSPAGLPGPWRLEGPEGFVETGAGDANLMVSAEGAYTLTWLPLPGWSLPEPATLAGTLVEGGAPVSFAGTYGDPPFAAVTAGPLGDPGAGRGASMVDVDADGDLDLYLCRHGDANRLLRNDGDLAFTDIATGPLAAAGANMAATWIDLDNDGDQDVYLVRDGQPNLLLEQGADGTFADIAQFGVGDAGAGRAASWDDYDGDGKLDLYLANEGTSNQLFHCMGDIGLGHYSYFPVSSDFLQHEGATEAAPWADVDGDGDRDLYLVNAGEANLLLENWNGTAFQLDGEMANTESSRAAAWGDVDEDGDPDLYLVNGGQADVLYRDDGDYYEVVTGPALGDPGAGRAVVLADLDNDGHLDLFVARHQQPALLAFGDGDGAFLPSTALLAEAGGPCTAVACGDVDGDGGLDLYISRDGEPSALLRNQIVARGHWLQLDLRGDATNADAIGARVRVVTAAGSQVREVSAGGEGLAQHARRVAFGLGAATTADSVIVAWPAGATTVLTGVAADRVVVVHEAPGTPVADDASLPAATRLLAAQPNPFNPTTTLAFDLARTGPAQVAIFALDGRRIAVLLDDVRPAGRHEVTWRGRDQAGRGVASGTYLARLRTGEGTWTQRLALVR